MRLSWFRFAVPLLFVLCTAGLYAQPGVENPDPGSGGGGGNSCYQCYRSVKISGEVVDYCGASAPGVGGATSCTVEYYPEGSYCYTYGSYCCN